MLQLTSLLIYVILFSMLCCRLLVDSYDDNNNNNNNCTSTVPLGHGFRGNHTMEMIMIKVFISDVIITELTGY